MTGRTCGDGVGESHVGWRPVQEALSRHYDTIAVDLPGFGNSPALPPHAIPTASALADALEDEMTALGLADFHVAGYSLGGRITLELARRGRVRSVVAIAPDGLGSPPERLYQAAALMTGRSLARMLAPSAELVAATGAGRSLFFAMERSRPWQLTADDARELLVTFAGAPAYQRTVHATLFDVPRRLDQIGCPVLLLQGTADPLVSGQAARFLPFLSDARLRWLPGLSHVPISDDPDMVARFMLDFLAEAANSSGRRVATVG